MKSQLQARKSKSVIDPPKGKQCPRHSCGSLWFSPREEERRGKKRGGKQLEEEDFGEKMLFVGQDVIVSSNQDHQKQAHQRRLFLKGMMQTFETPLSLSS